MWTARLETALGLSGAAAVAAHAVLIGALAPGLEPIWLSHRVAAALARSGLSPRQGIVLGPVTVAGFQEPSLVFLLGADTVLGDAEDAAVAIGDRRPAIVEARQESAFLAALAADGRGAVPVESVTGLDYSNNRRDTLIIYRPALRAKPPPRR